MTIKFPRGKVGEELLYYTGTADLQTIGQRSEASQSLAPKCKPGKTVRITPKELDQLIEDTETAIDVKQDHIGYGWTRSQQGSLLLFLDRLRDTKHKLNHK